MIFVVGIWGDITEHPTKLEAAEYICTQLDEGFGEGEDYKAFEGERLAIRTILRVEVS